MSINLTILEQLRALRNETIPVVTIDPDILQTTNDIDKVVSPILYILGFPGNILSCILWLQPRMRHSSGVYLAALGFVDLAFLAIHVMYELHKLWGIDIYNHPFLCEAMPVFFMATQYLSPMLVLGFTVERFIGVVYPNKRQAFCTIRRALIVTSCLGIFSLLLGSIQGWFYEYSGFCDLRGAAVKGGHNSVWSIWSWITEMLVFLCVPSAILILNILIIRQVKRFADFEYTCKTRAYTTTLSLLMVSFYLIVTTFPVSVVYVMRYFYMPSEHRTEFVDPNEQMKYILAKTIVDEIGMTHHAMKFYIFLLAERLFREELVRVFTALFTYLFRHRHGYVPQTEANVHTDWVAEEHLDTVHNPEETNI